MTGVVRILAMRHASFYAPLIGTVAGGFLEAEGLEGRYAVRPPERNPFEMIMNGEVEVMQSAVSSSWARIGRGITNLPLHFGRINRRDGFWLLARESSSKSPFDWSRLEGRTVLADHGPQPLAMLRYAAHLQGIDLDRVRWENAGDPSAIVARWRSGDGDFAHLQGPAPQGLAGEGLGTVVTAVGDAMEPVAFSSIAATERWLESPEARSFMRAYTRCLGWVQDTPAEDIAQTLGPSFEDTPMPALVESVAAYKRLGCWDRKPEIPVDEYERALDVFEWNGLIKERYAYETVVRDPWAE